LHGVDGMEQPVLRRKLRRGQVLAFFSHLPPTLVAMEACGASHYWARELQSLGHKVRLIPPAYVKPYGAPRRRVLPVEEGSTQRVVD
jgi:transposase